MSAVEIDHQHGLMHRLESIYQDVDNATLVAHLWTGYWRVLRVPPHLPARHRNHDGTSQAVC